MWHIYSINVNCKPGHLGHITHVLYVLFFFSNFNKAYLKSESGDSVQVFFLTTPENESAERLHAAAGSSLMAACV